MPTYHIRDTKTDDIYEEFCSYDELEKFLKDNPRYKQAPTTINIVGGVGDRTKIDGGMKEVMQKIASNHPNSPLADRFGSGESHGKIKAKSILRKRGLIKWEMNL